MENNNSKTIATKLSLAAAQKLERICERLGTNSYTVLQQLVTVLIKFCDVSGGVMSPDIRMIVTAFFNNLKQYYNLCTLADPNAQPDVLGAILIMGSHKKTDVGQLVMVDEPYMGTVTDNWNVKDMIERVMSIADHNLYLKLRNIGSEIDSNSVMETVIKLVEMYDTETDADYIDSLFRDNERSIFGTVRPDVVYKRRCNRSLSSFEHKEPKQTTINFTDEDKEVLQDYEKGPDFRPFGAPD